MTIVSGVSCAGTEYATSINVVLEEIVLVEWSVDRTHIGFLLKSNAQRQGMMPSTTDEVYGWLLMPVGHGRMWASSLEVLLDRFPPCPIPMGRTPESKL